MNIMILSQQKHSCIPKAFVCMVVITAVFLSYNHKTRFIHVLKMTVRAHFFFAETVQNVAQLRMNGRKLPISDASGSLSTRFLEKMEQFERFP